MDEAEEAGFVDAVWGGVLIVVVVWVLGVVFMVYECLNISISICVSDEEQVGCKKHEQ